MTGELRDEIKKWKKLNREKRNCREDKLEREKLYWQWHQKELVKHLIRKELGKHEETLTRDIREAKDSGVKMWTMINKLKGMESWKGKHLYMMGNV